MTAGQERELRRLAGAGGDEIPAEIKAAEAAQRIQELSSQRTGQAEWLAG
jgi:hypothetical protein